MPGQACGNYVLSQGRQIEQVLHGKLSELPEYVRTRWRKTWVQDGGTS